MSNPDNVARLREIKRLLDRIQQLPHVAAGAGNGVHNGFHPEPATSAGNGVHNGFYPEPPLSPPLPEPPPPPMEAEAEPTAPFARPIAPAGPLNVREAFRDDSRALVPVEPKSAVGFSPWLFVVATAVNTIIAAVLAVVITLGVARRDQPSGEPEAAASRGKKAAYVPAAGKDHAEPPLARPIELLPLGTPGEPLRLEALKPSRLPLQVLPEEAMQATYILVLSGLPANAALSGGTRMGSDSWLLPPGALKQLEIIVPEWSASAIEVGVELRHVNGAVAAQGKAWLAVPPPPVPQGTKLDQAAIKELLQNGDRLLARGDVAAARAIYERAAALGSAQAAFALGSTYDPSRLWSLGVFGMVGNKERARHWYQRADQLGHPEAKARLRAMRN